MGARRVEKALEQESRACVSGVINFVSSIKVGFRLMIDCEKLGTISRAGNKAGNFLARKTTYIINTKIHNCDNKSPSFLESPI